MSEKAIFSVSGIQGGRWRVGSSELGGLVDLTKFGFYSNSNGKLLKGLRKMC